MSAKHTDSPPANPEPRHEVDEPLSLRQLTVFATLVDAGSFTNAAARLGLGQPTVSGHMAELEQRLGLRLVHRSRRGVTPTTAGKALLDAVRATIASEQQVRLRAAELHGLIKGSVTVGASTIPAVYLLPQWLGQFRKETPNVKLRLETAASDTILQALNDGTIDVAVVGAPVSRRGLHAHAIAEDRLILIFPPGHAFAERTTVSLPEVMQETLVIRPPGSGTRRAMLEGLGISDLSSLGSPMQVDSTEGVKAAVRAGLGVSFVSSLAAKDELEYGLLRTTTVEDFDVHRTFHLVTRTGEKLSPATKAFVEMVLAASQGD